MCMIRFRQPLNTLLPRMAYRLKKCWMSFTFGAWRIAKGASKVRRSNATAFYFSNSSFRLIVFS